MSDLWSEERDQVVFLYNTAHLCYSFIRFCPEDEREYRIILVAMERLEHRFSQLTGCSGKLGLFGTIGLLFAKTLSLVFDAPEREEYLERLKHLFIKLSEVKTELLL